MLRPALIAFGVSIATFGIGMFLGEGISGVLAYLFWGLANLVACFLIVREYPKSVWIVWFPCNLVTFIGAVIEPNFWRTEMWMLHTGILALSVAGSVSGRVLPKKTRVPSSNSPAERSVPG